MKILALDLEASNLAADFGIMLTFGSKIVGKGKPEVLRIDDYLDESRDLIKAEKRLLKDVSKRMLDCDIWLGHFACYYDIPFINSRLLYHQLPILPPNFNLIDTWRISRNKLKLRNNRLNTIQEFLQLKDEKNAIRPEQWIRALSGHRPSMNYIVEHNRRDVLVLEQAYERLKPLVADFPGGNVVTKDGKCPACGQKHFQRRGLRRTRTKTFHRVQCQKCGWWGSESKPITN